MGYPIQVGQTAQPLMFLMVLSSDHVTGATGLSPTVTLSKSGGAFASPAGAVSEVGSGWYKVAGNATDSGTLGPLVLHATVATADPCDDRFDVVAYNPQSATNLGLSALPSSGTLTVNPTLNATQSFNNSGQTTRNAVTLAAADVSGNLPADVKAINALTTSAVVAVGQYIGQNVAAVLVDGTGHVILAVTPPTAAAIAAAILTDTTAGDLAVVGSLGHIVTTAPSWFGTAQTGDAYARIGAAGAGLTAIGPVTLAPVTHTGAIIPHVTLVDTLTTYTGNTPQTGDNFALIGAIKATTDELATALVTDGAGGFQFTITALANAPAGGGGGGDPWVTPLPGAYASGEAGEIVGGLATSVNAIGTLVTAVKTVTDDLMTALQSDGVAGFQFTPLALAQAPGGAAMIAFAAASPRGLAGAVLDGAPTTAGCKTSGLPTSGTYPAAGASLQIIFTAGALAGRDFKATYVPGAAGTQALAFTATLPSAPANGDTFVALEIPS